MTRSLPFALVLGCFGLVANADAQDYRPGSYPWQFRVLPGSYQQPASPWYGYRPWSSYYNPQPAPQPIPQPVPNGPPILPHDDHYHVQYRQMQWQEQCFGNPYEAAQFEACKRADGYEVRSYSQGRHVTVSYRLPIWTNYRTVTSHRLAHDLERRLEAQGYQARVVHH